MGISRSEFFFSSRRRHTRCSRDWSSDVCSSDLLTYARFSRSRNRCSSRRSPPRCTESKGACGGVFGDRCYPRPLHGPAPTRGTVLPLSLGVGLKAGAFFLLPGLCPPPPGPGGPDRLFL